MISFEEPFLTASTTLQLSHLNSMFLLESILLQTTQLNRIGTISFAVMLIGAHSADQGTVKETDTLPSYAITGAILLCIWESCFTLAVVAYMRATNV